jgi:hypothetical protein
MSVTMIDSLYYNYYIIIILQLLYYYCTIIMLEVSRAECVLGKQSPYIESELKCLSMRLQVLTVASMNMIAFWNILPCSLVEAVNTALYPRNLSSSKDLSVRMVYLRNY